MGEGEFAYRLTTRGVIHRMKALRKLKPGPGNVELVEVEEPVCRPDGVKIEVRFTGICGTDLHVLHDTFKNYPPVTLGHEFSGIVTEVGSEVRSVRPGDRVAVLPSSAVVCGKCEYCRQGYYMFCPIRRGMGHGVDGSFTRYVVVREDQVYPLPDEVSFEEAAVAEAFASAVQAVEELTSFGVGETVLLSGPGPIGLLCLLLLVRRGCRVIAAGTSQDVARLELARLCGAAVIVDVERDNLQEVVGRETGGRGADAVFECAGAAASVKACLQAVGKRGCYVQVGIIGKEISLDFDTILFKQLRVYGTVGHSLRTWDKVMSILRQRDINIASVITHKFPLSRWREAFDLCEAKQGAKVLISYDE
jgi:L-iditol 2-dehydrogenase